MRPGRSRRVQAQRKFAQGAYVPPNAVTVAAVENRRCPVRDARNVTINNVTATSLLDVVSLHSVHSHLTSQPVVLLERLRGRNLSRDVPPPPQTEASPPQQQPKSTKKTAELPKLQADRKKQDCKSVHPMSLRSRRLSKLELNKLLAQRCAPLRKTASKRKKTSSDDDEPLIIFQKTRKKNPAAATIESHPWEKSLKAKTSKDIDVPRKSTAKEIKTNPVSSKHIKENSAKKRKSAPQKSIPKEFSPKKPALVNLVTRNDAAVNSVVVPVNPAVAPVAPVIVPDAPIVVPDAPVVVPDAPVVVPGSPVVGPDIPVVARDASVVGPDAPIVGPGAPVVGPGATVETAEQNAAYLARLDTALAALDDLPDLDNLSDIDDEPTVRKEVHDEVPLNQRDIADPDPPTSSPDSLLVYHWDDSDDEPMVRREAAVKQVQRTNDSPAPGPSGMQIQLRKNNSDTVQDTGVADSSKKGNTLFKNVIGNISVNFKIKRKVQTLPKTCAAAAWRSELDVIKASKEQLDSRCKVCQGCQRIEKILRDNRSDSDSSTEASENELKRQNGETESGEMANEKRTVAGEKGDGYIRSDVPSEHSNVTTKVRTPVIYGKAILGVDCGKSGETLKKKKELFQLGGNKHVNYPNVNPEGLNVNSEIQNDNRVGRRISISSDSTGTSNDSNTEQEKLHRARSERKKIKYQKVVATRRRLADAKVKQAGIREQKESDTRIIEKKEGNETSSVEHKKNCEVELSRITMRFEEMQKEKAKEIARLKVEIRDTVRAEMEADRRMLEEVDTLAQTLDKEKDAKSMHPRQSADLDEPGTSESMSEGGTLVDAPIYFPTLEEFQDPVSFYEKIYPETMKYGFCKVVPPPGWKPPSEVHGDIRFDIMNQYISRLFSRWGPAARELSAIKLCLHQHTNINFSRPPQLDGVEINLPKLYHLVQRLGGLESVINKNRWGKVADDLKITKSGNYEKRLDNIYMKFLLAYDTLSHQERQEIMRKVEVSWNKKNQKLLDRAMNPLYRQQRMLGLLDSSDDETEDENIKTALKQAEDCIIKGHIMQHSRFKKVASMAYENTFGPGSEAAAPPSLAYVEELYWRLVTSGTEHVCVHTAAIDTGTEGHGFTTSEEPYASHKWNPKQVINNPRNVLRYLGPVVGVTVPTLLLGMLFSTSCWHKDPHGVAWFEYQSKGPARIWYGIPADQADNFRKAVETLSPTSCQNKALWLSSEIAMIPPSVLREHNVRLTRVTQNEGEFIMTFPNAYTSCISTGYTESESVYLASSQWIDFMWFAFKIARDSCEPTMFSIEQLLYNIGRDKEAEQDLLKRALPLYDKMLRKEVTNRQMLQERGLPFVQQLMSSQGEQQSSTNSARPLEECDFCRVSLFLSKVKGLPARNSVMCLEHTLALLDTDKHKDTDVGQLQLLVHVSVKELNKVHDDMRRWQRTKS